MSKQQQPAHDLSTLGFHGSYRPEDVTFLLQIDDLEPTPLAEKEYLIQSGEKHYSQMISVEQPPSDEQMRHFHYAFEQGADRLASDVQKIANSLRKRFKEQPIILVSLVRAGVPLGVLQNTPLLSISLACITASVLFVTAASILQPYMPLLISMVQKILCLSMVGQAKVPSAVS